MVVRELALDLPEALRDQIIAHAQQGYPEEVCGLVSGRAGMAHAVHPGRNVSLTPRVAYEMDVDTLALQIEFEETGLELWAIYHSHPRGPAAPSPTDIKLAMYPDARYVIVNLTDPARPTVAAFRIAVALDEPTTKTP